jgi:hypothetical protein
MSRRGDHDAAPGSRSAGRHEVVLSLDRLRDLFAPPALDEFGGSADTVSGIERLFSQLVAARPRGSVAVSVTVPEAEITPGLEERMRASVRRYCDLKLVELEHRHATLRHEGWHALWQSFPLLVGAGIIDGLVRHRGLLDLEGFVLVLVWVVLWYPLDTLLWYSRPVAHEIRVMRAMRDMYLTVQAAPGPDDTAAGGARSPDRFDLADTAQLAASSPAAASRDGGARRGDPRRWLGGRGRGRAGP